MSIPKKGRDLFDLDMALDHSEFDGDLLRKAFDEYMKFNGTPATRVQFEANMAGKIRGRGIARRSDSHLSLERDSGASRWQATYQFATICGGD